MTTITIKNGIKLAKTQFESIADLQDYLFLVQMENNYELSAEHIKLLKQREIIADKNPKDGFTWKEMKGKIKRKHV